MSSINIEEVELFIITVCNYRLGCN